jgi:hypothetical protein
LSTLINKFDNKLVADIKSINRVTSDFFLNDTQLFTRAVSVDSLKKASVCLQKNSGIVFKEINSLNAFWFNETTKKLLEGSFKYPDRIRMSIHKFHH